MSVKRSVGADEKIWSKKAVEDKVLEIVREQTPKSRRSLLVLKASLESLGIEYAELVLIVSDIKTEFDIVVNERSLDGGRISDIVEFVLEGLRREHRLK